jgi:hypothetical protein
MKVEVNVGAEGVTLEDMCQQLRLLYKELEFTVCTAGINCLTYQKHLHHLYGGYVLLRSVCVRRKKTEATSFYSFRDA